jgi:GDP-4-dehydro-6-deoxy-D-mannose reductase
MRILITGCTGFAGGYLTEALLARKEAELVGVSRRAQWPRLWRHLAGKVTLRVCDLGERKGIEAVLREVQPEQIYHLAGYASTGQSFREPDAAWAGNLYTTRNLYEAIIRWGGRPRVLYVSSGLVYDAPPTPGQLVDETYPLQPVSPYAASKAAADLASYQYSRAPGLDIVRVRPFNHIGPRQSSEYAVANFARQIAAIEKGRQSPLVETGDLSPRRDLTDVRDMAQAYVLLMDKGRGGEAYNAGSGAASSMREVLDRLVALAKVRVQVRQKAQKMRVTETSVLLADCGKLRRETGWEPRLSLEQTLADTLDFWRANFGRGGKERTPQPGLSTTDQVP